MTENLQDYVNFKPFYKKHKRDGEEVVYYDTSFYCKENMLIHPNLKSAISCNNCFTDQERLMFKNYRNNNK